jgi:hypothetical protein
MSTEEILSERKQSNITLNETDIDLSCTEQLTQGLLISVISVS